ncbi:MAG TPA: PQQ-binding-like beta-propeller repeat protein [Blastocatellia bacterium]|nr:PQQ-binding-like beta-propeller repeat protein [Blastocatellia bacterium]
MSLTRRSFLTTSLTALPGAALAANFKPEQNWPEFRGTGARGVAEGFPTLTNWKITPTAEKPAGLLWRTEVPGLGHCSPIIWKDRIYLATAIPKTGKPSLRIGLYGDIKPAKDDDEQRWAVMCYDKKNGKLKWEQVIRTAKPSTVRHEKASHANTTLVTDGKRLIAFFGAEGLYCFDMKGKLLWQKDLGKINVTWRSVAWGYSSSPALYKDRIVVLCDDPKDPFVAAFHLSDGKELWRTSRKGACENSWGTPLIHADGERTQIVTNGYPFIASYDLETGKELWRLRGGGDIPVPTPFAADGLIVLTNAHGGKTPLFAVRPSATGDISLTDGTTSNDSVAWSAPNGGAYISTPVMYGGYLYVANYNGLLRCYDFKTGEKMFEERLGTDAVCSASLVAADGKIYCPTEDGIVYVLKAGPKLEVLAKNELGEPCLATPAISQGVLYFRTSGSLMAIG